MKVLLIVPPRNIQKSSIKRCCTPIGLAYIAAVLEKNGIKVEILDCYAEGYNNERELTENYILVGLDDCAIKEKILKSAPDYVGVTCSFTSELENALHICRLTKTVNRKIKVVLGGLHPTNFSEELYQQCPEIDFIVKGEGEYSFLSLINGKEPKNEKIKDLDSIPFPARHLLKMDIYLKINKHMTPYPKKSKSEQILTSRGCPGHCIFCSSSNFWGHEFRTRSPGNVIEEMKHLKSQYGIEEFQFIDDTMTLDKKRAMKIFELMKPLNVAFCMPNGVFINSLSKEMIKKMAEAGCYQVTFSVESGSKKSLKLIRKEVDLEKVKPLVDYSRSLGISTHATFVLGIPGESVKDIKESFRFASKCNFDSVSFFIVSPLPGSALYSLCKEKGYLTEESLLLDFKTSRINNPDLPPRKLEKIVRRQNSLFISHFLFRHPIRFFRKYGKFIKENPTKFYKIFGRVT